MMMNMMNQIGILLQIKPQTLEPIVEQHQYKLKARNFNPLRDLFVMIIISSYSRDHPGGQQAGVYNSRIFVKPGTDEVNGHFYLGLMIIMLIIMI